MSGHMTLKDFVAKHNQYAVANMMGVSQGAVSQMIRANRDIRVAPDQQMECGYRFYEIRPLGKNIKAA
jgi:predicted transcriptional regulator